MPQKVLRSLIHELFPLELRIEIDLLSRRRDIVNEEKQDEIFNLLRKYNIYDDITKLGQGTNRYAFRIKGYVVKVATDADGKIDNLKEFKMAKRLFPHVARTYEVARNGTLLVAEYIQPFSSSSELMAHADQIREILGKFSSVYLIGDVGIDSKNYVNWGCRTGSDEPVCLDFAYIYDVSSSYFICSRCKHNSMLVPNKDFTLLYCPSPDCGAKYTFEDIRMRIGSDPHRLEIGDLEEEGYLLTESNVNTELTPERSNYLEEKKPQKQEVIEEPVVTEPDNFELQFSPEYYYNGGFGRMDNLKAVEALKSVNAFVASINGTATAVNSTGVHQNVEFEADVPTTKVVGIATVVRKETPAQVLNVPASAVKVEDNPTNEVDVNTDPFECVKQEEETPVVEEDKPEVAEDPFTYGDETTAEDSVESSVQDVDPDEFEPVEFDQFFIENMSDCISTLSNHIGAFVERDNLFNRVRNDLKSNISQHDFYRTVQNAVFRSICIYLELVQTEVPNNNKPGTHKVWEAPSTEVIYGPKFDMFDFVWDYYDFFSRAGGNPVDCIYSYRENQSRFKGLDLNWLPEFERRLQQKLTTDEGIIDEIVGSIADYMREYTYDTPSAADEVEDTVTGADTIETGVIETAPVQEEVKEEPVEEATTAEESTDVEFSADVPDEDDEYYLDDDYVDPAEAGVSVNIFDEGSMTVCTIEYYNGIRTVAIPLQFPSDYHNDVENVVYEGNGSWDWLAHISPNQVFTASDPNKWINAVEIDEEDTMYRIICLGKQTDREDSLYLMGIYKIDQIILAKDNTWVDVINNATYQDMLNAVVAHSIAGTFVSALERTKAASLIDCLTEEEVENSTKFVDETATDAAEVTKADTTASDLESAAIAALSEGAEENVVYKPIRRPRA